MKYIVYKHTAPSGNSYVGYTKNTLEARWRGKIKDLKKCDTPLAHALRKYPPDQWTHEVLFETDNKQEAWAKEKEFIVLYGYYNLAKGGSGGNTGRNHELEKIARQAKSLSDHWKGLSAEEKKRRTDLCLEVKRRNGNLRNAKPKSGKEHYKWIGYWVVNNVRYETLDEATKKLKVNQSTILDTCVRKVDYVFKSNGKFVEKGKTPRECGCYREYTDKGCKELI